MISRKISWAFKPFEKTRKSSNRVPIRKRKRILLGRFKE